ncbi:hypothetical protein LSS_21710 [Leptospira santarosai serovar Shermani str. LT 821]|uniref:Uncharacterized protein n=1 Tax=Leptospira santarosai serovar Shermani str. LT 821 TaxID=758847 RepID=A0A097ESJ7_9LEPT|nr:hypothetical protein LSS_21710 [Leptospira santarosai serovar Shermani str. LT 821]
MRLFLKFFDISHNFNRTLHLFCKITFTNPLQSDSSNQKFECQENRKSGKKSTSQGKTGSRKATPNRKFVQKLKKPAISRRLSSLRLRKQKK